MHLADSNQPDWADLLAAEWMDEIRKAYKNKGITNNISEKVIKKTAVELTKALDKGQIAFDTLISTPAMMAKLGKYARVLGPRGLMPNPKSGTVTPDVAKAVKEAKAGRVEYRVDSTGIVHIGVGKVSFGKDKLTENVKAVVTSVKGAKPASVKGNYFKSVFVTTTMGPSMRVALSEVQ